MKKRTKSFIALVLIVIVAGGAYATYQAFGPASESVEENTEQILTIEAAPGTVSVRVEGPSMVEPFVVRDVRARSSGSIAYAPSEGDIVRSGSAMVRFDLTDMEIAVTQAELNLDQSTIDLRKAEIALEKARKDLVEKERLAENGAVAETHVTAARELVVNAELVIEGAEVRQRQLELSLEKAELDLDSAVVTAPFSGVVLASNVGAGDTVNSGAVLLTLADVSRVRLWAEVDEYDIGKIAPGMTASVTTDAVPDETLKSKVERISPAAEVINNISVFRVSTVLGNDDGLLRPGMSADMSILIRSDKGLVVPSKTVSTVRGRSYIDVYENEEIVTKRITIGADDGTNTAVLEGIDEGAMVVLPQTAAFTLSSAASTAGTSIVPITVPGTGGAR
jgi:RND family efflux transporter MFP subunit